MSVTRLRACVICFDCCLLVVAVTCCFDVWVDYVLWVAGLCVISCWFDLLVFVVDFGFGCCLWIFCWLRFGLVLVWLVTFGFRLVCFDWFVSGGGFSWVLFW